MAEQRLPIVDGDDGAWGDILNQYLAKEHYDTGVDNIANGGHKNITIRPGTTSAGSAPLKFTSGPLMSSPEVGAVEFLTDKLYLTQTSSTVRKVLAAYDDTSGATGDIYYRDSGSNFVRLGVGGASDVLGVTAGLPAWKDLGSTYQVTSAKGQPSGYASLDSNGLVAQEAKYHNHQAGVEGDPVITPGSGGDAGKVMIATADAWFFNDSTRDSLTHHIIAQSAYLTLTDDLDNGNIIVADRDTDSWVVQTSMDQCDYLRYIPYAKVIKRAGSTNLHTQMINLKAHGEIESFHERVIRVEPMKREPDALLGLSITDTTLDINLGGGGVWSNSHRYIISPVSATTRQFECVVNTGVWTYNSHTTPVLNTTYYNDINSGLVAINTNKYAIMYVFMGVENEDHIYTLLSHEEYDSMVLAQASSNISLVPPLITSHAIFVGRVCFKQGATTSADWVCEGAFDTIFTASSPITDHGFLSGLSDDDHTIYPKVLGRPGGQTISGGTGVADILSLKGTTGNGTSSSPAIQTLVGNDGGTVATTILNSGKYGIGISSPTATLNIKAGGTAAETAPIKLTSGSLMTAPEVGAVEFLTDKLYLTQTTGTTRKTVAIYDDSAGATGDMYYRDSNGHLVRLGVGSNTNVLKVNSGLPSWQPSSSSHTPTAVWGDGISSSSVQTGTVSYVRVPYSGTITSWSIVADISITCVLDIWKSNGSVPTVANTITAAAKPSLSTASTASSSTLTGWTTSVVAGDVFGFKLDSLTGSPKSITLVLEVAS